MEDTMSLEEAGPEEIERRISHTQDALSDKIGRLKTTIGASIGEAEHTVRETVQKAADVFNWRHQVDRHPWGALATTIAIGYVVGSKLAQNRQGEENVKFEAPNTLTNYPEQVGSNSGRKLESSVSTVGDAVLNSVNKQFREVKSDAVDALLGIVRETIVSAVPGYLGTKIGKVIDALAANVR